ncbi:hypothetical protein B0H17DRAFT_1209512 [Mycena rosella]|uniref:Uncharacterized protein n=1 Tax=Mycena rosella TaxID=1033263 RepID=A0AAD7CZH2_MYCRO|nr:hypothetical protein B0H17DRAFT_1209512 [Mycena rosella]
MDSNSPLTMRTRPVTPPHRRRSTSRRVPGTTPQRRTLLSPHRSSVVLTCGAELKPAIPSPTDQTPWGSSEKWAVPFLPLPLDDPPLSRRPAVKPTTGCGARIHSHASPRGAKTWTGCSDAAGRTAVPLPGEYFTDEQRCQLGGGPRKEECGCTTVGVGCCVCGNTLGVHKTVCRAHRKMLGAAHPTSYTFLADAVSPPLPRRSKIPVTIDRSEPRTPPRNNTHDLVSWNNWLGQSRERLREPSPTRSEMESLAAQMYHEAALEEGRLRLQAEFGQARPVDRRGIEWPEFSSAREDFSDTSVPDLIPMEDVRAAAAQDMMSGNEIVAWTLRQPTHRNIVVGQGSPDAGSALFSR